MPTEKNNLGSINQRLSRLEKTKAGSDLVKNEFRHINRGLEEMKTKIDKGHACTNMALIENLESQLRESSNSVRKLYIWQSSVGVSLLVFFLTVGVAALRFVDGINTGVKANEVRLGNIEKDSEQRLDANKEINKALLDFIKSHAAKTKQ